MRTRCSDGRLNIFRAFEGNRNRTVVRGAVPYLSGALVAFVSSRGDLALHSGLEIMHRLFGWLDNILQRVFGRSVVKHAAAERIQDTISKTAGWIVSAAVFARDSVLNLAGRLRGELRIAACRR